jgi:hypothetical protein
MDQWRWRGDLQKLSKFISWRMIDVTEKALK